MKYSINKANFRDDARYGRTTVLLLDGVQVLSLMGVVPKNQMIRQYEELVATDYARQDKKLDRYIKKLERKYA